MVLGTRALVISLATMFAVTLYSISELGSMLQVPQQEVHEVQRHRNTETHTPREVLHHQHQRQQTSPSPSKSGLGKDTKAGVEVWVLASLLQCVVWHASLDMQAYVIPMRAWTTEVHQVL